MRILVTGASGSGTTTLAKALAQKLNGQFLDADDFFWCPTQPPYQQRRDKDERLQLMLSQLANAETSVVSGSIMNWGAELETSFDLIVFLYLATDIRVQRVKQREIEKHGHVNADFLAWVADYDDAPKEGRSLKKHNAWLAQQQTKVLRIEGDFTVAERVAQVEHELQRKAG